ncbi:MAG: hypothetical protein ACMUIU_18040 [bacterium]
MSGNRVRILTIIYPFLIMAFFTGCGDTYQSKTEIEKEIRGLLSLREEAMENKDIELYMECISRSYSDKNDTYESIREKMKKNFLAFDRIDFSQYHQTVYFEDDLIMVVQDYELAFIIGGKRDFVRGREKIFLERTGREWKIVKGL